MPDDPAPVQSDSSMAPSAPAPRREPAPSEITTLVDGATVVLSTTPGDIRPDVLLGVFHRDERLISSLRVSVDGDDPPLLAADRTSASSDRIASLAALDKYRNGQALLVRRRTVEAGRYGEVLELRSFHGPRTVMVEIVVQADGASVLALKSGKSPSSPLPWTVDGASRAVARGEADADIAVVQVDAAAAIAAEGDALHLLWKAELEPGTTWTGSWSVVASAGDGEPARSVGSREALAELRVEASDHRWTKALASSIDDLRALVITLPETGERFFAAGAPWYLALFGRDSLLTAWESLPLGTELALDVLDTLAAHQGRESHTRRREEPGKILHELRIGAPQVFGMERGAAYYGTVDASPLFVMLLAEAYRWGAPVERVRALLPAARAALQWCRQYGTAPGGEDRSPFLWYWSDSRGLSNQGWKDSGDCMVHADGTLASGPFAVAEAQGYFFEALHGLARLERDLGDPDTAESLKSAAASLAEAFARDFVDADSGLVAMALDGASNPLRVASSNMGQCLWSGILAGSLVDRVARRATAPDLLCRWGIRTLGDAEVAYNPLGYHLGTVWAHDTAFIAAGLARHGAAERAQLIVDGLLDAAEQFDWRLPELYSGLDVAGDRSPLPYPAACSPQAWAAGAPVLLLRSILGIEPDVPAGRLDVRPLLRDGDRIKVEGLRIGDRTITIDATGSTATVTGW
jgi:glycogen debranching enzyme